LIAAVSLVQTNFEALGQDINRYAEHDPHGDPQRRACSQGARIAYARSAIAESDSRSSQHRTLGMPGCK
jgi:hypothetical protein